MTATKSPAINKQYIIVVSILTFVVPVFASLAESMVKHIPFSFVLAGKWFIFSAVGLRLFTAGLKQAVDPTFTAKEIFHIDSTESLPIVRELGFANICFGLIGIASLWFPSWRIVSAFGSGLYYGIAGLQHLIKIPAGANEWFALVTDLVIFVCLAWYFVVCI